MKINNANFAAGLAIAIAGILAPATAEAAFSGSLVPISVKTLPCDSNPRIVVEFSDASQNVWYPANAGDNSKQFLAAALAAKTASQGFWFYGTGPSTDPTPYCISATARPATMFGLTDSWRLSDAVTAVTTTHH